MNEIKAKFDNQNTKFPTCRVRTGECRSTIDLKSIPLTTRATSDLQILVICKIYNVFLYFGRHDSCHATLSPSHCDDSATSLRHWAGGGHPGIRGGRPRTVGQPGGPESLSRTVFPKSRSRGPGSGYLKPGPGLRPGTVTVSPSVTVTRT